MPIHDWTRVDPGLFHAFHQGWITGPASALNRSVLPREYFALCELSFPASSPDVLKLNLPDHGEEVPATSTGRAITTDPPRTRIVRHAGESLAYLRRVDRITIRYRDGEPVAVIEIVSPGNKASVHALSTFVEKSAELIGEGVHLLVIDLFPPSRRDPQGIHKAIWDGFIEEDFQLPADQPLTLASYEAQPDPTAYVETIAVGDVLPDMPIFLKPGYYVPAPLEASYRRTWDEFFPAPFRRMLETPTPEDAAEEL